MQQLCNGTVVCNPGRRKQHSLQQEGAGKATDCREPPWIWPSGSETIAKVGQIDLSEGNSPLDMVMPDSPFCSNSPCQHPPAILNTPVFLQVYWLSQSPLWHLQRKLSASHSLLSMPFATFSQSISWKSSSVPIFHSKQHWSSPCGWLCSNHGCCKSFSPLYLSPSGAVFFFLLFLSASLLLHLFSNLIWKHLCSHARAS